MSEDRPPSELYVRAQARIAAREGIPVTVLHKGDPNVGTLVLKINLLNGTARVLSEVRYQDQRVWTPATGEDPMPEAKADAYLTRQSDIDPDVWTIEIEDRQGRLWFPGKLLSL